VYFNEPGVVLDSSLVIELLIFIKESEVKKLDKGVKAVCCKPGMPISMSL